MPQVDLDALLCGGAGDCGKVSCDTMTEGDTPPSPEEDPDMPADSFLLRIGEEIDWTEINVVYERDDSTKGNTNPKSQHANPRQNQPQHRPSTSQRFSVSLKPKTPIIALPNKIRRSGHLGRSARRLSNALMFPEKRCSHGHNTAAPLHDPGSPQVSCFGKVLSDRVQAADSARRPVGGFWGRLVAAVSCGRLATRERVEAANRGSATIEKTASCSGRSSTAAVEGEGFEVAPLFGLAAMKRFSSLRRSESWRVVEKVDGEQHESCTPPFNRAGFMGRRSVEVGGLARRRALE